MKKKLFYTVVFLFLAFSAVQTSLGGIPEIISYQGILTDTVGAPLNGNFNIAVNIYSQAEGGTVLWSETHTGVTVLKGVFTIMLGSINAFPTNMDFSVPYWLGVSINAGNELTPRTQFASAATAFAAKRAIENGVPAGMIGAFATPAAPAGWLECNGQVVSRLTFARLFTAIGTTYGAGNGSTTFNLPDYRGEFLRGWDHGRGADPDASSRTNAGDGSTTGDKVGTKQADRNANHTHRVTIPISGYRGTSAGGVYRGYIQTDNTGNTWHATARPVATTANPTDSGTGESRARNISVMYCIKY